MSFIKTNTTFFKLFFCTLFSLFIFSIQAQIKEPEIDLNKEPFYYNLKKALKHPEAVYKLSLCNQALNEFPPDIFKFINLRLLYLDSNKISVIPAGIKELKHLYFLSLDSNQISDLPDDLFETTSLKALYLDNNKITLIPPKIGLLFNLRRLSFHKNFIRELPIEIGALRDLVVLDFGENQIKRIPDEFCHLYSLEKLSFTKNNLKKLPPHFGELASLNSLYLSENNFANIDSNISKLKKLEILALDKNELTELPSSMGAMFSLEKLYLETNSFQTLPSELGNLFKLKILNIGENPIKSIPTLFTDLRKLEKLYIWDIKFPTFPAVLFDIQRNGTEILGLKTKELYTTKLLMSQGKNKKLTENYVEAIPKFVELLKADTNNVEAMSELAACYVENSEYEKASAICKKALNKDPSVEILDALQITYSNSQNKINKSSNINAFYEEKIKANPKDAQPIFEYGKYMYLQNKNEEAKGIFEKAIKIDPNHAYSQFYLAITNLVSENINPFIFATLRYITLEPKTNKTVTILPFLLTKMGMKTGVEKKQGSRSYHDSYIIRDENKEIIYKTEDPTSSVLMAMLMDIIASDLTKTKLSDTDSSKAIKKLVGEALYLNKNNVELFQIKLQKICKTENDSIPKNERWEWDYYLPYYNALISNNHLEAFSYIINVARREEEYIVKWIKENPTKVQAFYDWDKKYKWP